ncbi:MAG: rRNA processing protein [Pleopsidium flavum]|nr:MAG: rRNA processing protein [Pleopsidium flavum]
MGSSTKKKIEKKKDFQKAKLKVGKARPKASNFTDTSFKSKSIVLNKQSLTTAAPSTSLQFNHHLSLLTHRSDTQRRDSLSFLTSAITARGVNTSLPQPVSVILPTLLPLILDGSNGVRGQLIRLLRSLPAGEVEDHVDELLLYIRAGMTHLAADIRASAIELLDWLLEVAGQETVSCAGGWMKTMKCFLALLGWKIDDGTAKWSSSKASFGKAGSEGKALVKNLAVLASFIRVGLLPCSEMIDEELASNFPLWETYYHTLPKRSHCFAHLNLFGPPRDEESEMYEDHEERQRMFHARFQKPVERGLETTKKEGGEVGRAAAVVFKVVSEGIDGYDINN